MKAQDHPCTKLLSSAAQFVIPVFQRDYRWTEEQCSQLWEDVYQAGEATNPHFFGSVIYIASSDVSATFSKWLLIDGQQRITTVTLLFAALAHHADKIGRDKWAEQIKGYFLINDKEEGEKRRKLVLRERDEATLRWIVDRKGHEGEPSNISLPIKRNYDFFCSKLGDPNIDADRVYKGIEQLTIVDTILDRNRDDPQKIFESMNSTGIDLTQSDLVRNYILMDLREEEQAMLYNKYWQDMEKYYSGKDSQFDNFLRDFIALETRSQKQGRADEVYRTFQRTFKEQKNEIEKLEELLARMHRSAQFHSAIVIGRDDIHDSKEYLERLRNLATTSAILVIQLLYAREKDNISQEHLFEALNLIESYMVRRAVCDLQTRSYWKQFAELAYSLKEEKKFVLDLLKANIQRLPKNYAFPDDKAFKQSLSEKELYGRPICRYLLDRLENADSKEKTNTSSYTIEHIMPQDMPPEWKKMLGADWENVHGTWLHRLGNLTLTAYNQKYSNHSFTSKRDMENGFYNSPLRLNKYVGEQESWTENEMQKRTEDLTQQALKIWPVLSVSDDARRYAEEKALEREAIQHNRDEVLSHFDEVAYELFKHFEEKVLELHDDIRVYAIQKSVSYYISDFFCEVLPRRGQIWVLLHVDYDDVSDSDSRTILDPSQWQFLPNARHDAGSILTVQSKRDIDDAMPLFRQAIAALSD